MCFDILRYQPIAVDPADKVLQTVSDYIICKGEAGSAELEANKTQHTMGLSEGVADW